MLKIVSEELYVDDFDYKIDTGKCFLCGKTLKYHDFTNMERFCFLSSEGENGSARDVAVCANCYEKSVDKTNADRDSGEIYAHKCDFCEATFPYGMEGLALVSENGTIYYACDVCVKLSEKKKAAAQCNNEGFYSTIKECKHCGKLVYLEGIVKKGAAEIGGFDASKFYGEKTTCDRCRCRR